MKTKQLFVPFLLVGVMSGCTLYEMGTNQINSEKIKTFDQFDLNEPKKFWD